MGVLSNNPISQYEVGREWNCWPWSWTNSREDVEKVGNRLMQALGDDWEYWSEELKHITAMACYGGYATDEQYNRGVTGMKRLIKIIHKVTGERGTIVARSNPSGGYRVSPEFEIHFGDPNETQSFIFRMNEIRVVENGKAKTKKPSWPIQRFIPDFSEYRVRRPHFRGISGEIKWSCNGEALISCPSGTL